MTLSNKLIVAKKTKLEQLILLYTNLQIYQARGDLLNGSDKDSHLSFDDTKMHLALNQLVFRFQRKISNKM